MWAVAEVARRDEGSVSARVRWPRGWGPWSYDFDIPLKPGQQHVLRSELERGKAHGSSDSPLVSTPESALKAAPDRAVVGHTNLL